MNGSLRNDPSSPDHQSRHAARGRDMGEVLHRVRRALVLTAHPMTRFPTYPRDILDRADALLSSKYPDGIVDPRFVEVACEAMIEQREIDALKADDQQRRLRVTELSAVKWEATSEAEGYRYAADRCGDIAKAIRGTE